MNGLNLRSLPHELVDVLKSTDNGLSALLLQKIEQEDITCRQRHSGASSNLHRHPHILAVSYR